jgi:hypothetical protein
LLVARLVDLVRSGFAGRKAGVGLGVGSLLVARLAGTRCRVTRVPEFDPAGNIWLEMAAQAASATTRYFGLGRPMVLSRWQVENTIPLSMRKGCGNQKFSLGIEAAPPWPKPAVSSGFPSLAHRAQVVTPRGWRLHVITR